MDRRIFRHRKQSAEKKKKKIHVKRHVVGIGKVYNFMKIHKHVTISMCKADREPLTGR
jgi:hypothetical protein